MTDPYAETDDWPAAPATRPHSDAQPVSAPEPSGSTPEAGEGGRVARYAEAIRTMVRGHHPRCFQVRPEGIPDDLPRDLCDCRILWMLTAASEHQRTEVAAAAVVAALRLPERDRETAAKALDEGVVRGLQTADWEYGAKTDMPDQTNPYRASALREGRES